MCKTNFKCIGYYLTANELAELVEYFQTFDENRMNENWFWATCWLR